MVELRSGKGLTGNTKTIVASDEEVESVQFTLTEADLASYPYLNICINVYYTQAWGVTKTYYPMVRLATDSDPTYQPYAMTNKELTDAKANNSDLASISITGTTNSTGSTITAGKYFYLNGTLAMAKTDIANGATLTKNTNYVEITAGILNDNTSIDIFDSVAEGFTTTAWRTRYKNNMVFISHAFTYSGSLTADTWNVLGIIKSFARPLVTYEFWGIDNVNSIPVRMRITEDGKVQIFGNASLSNNLRYYLTYATI